MDLETILYVVIGIGWFALNAYKKAQQKKQLETPQRQRPEPVESHQPRQQESERSFEDMILEQLGGLAEDKEEQVLEPEPVPVRTQKNEDKFLNTDLTHSHLPDDYVMGQSEMKGHRVQRQVRKLEVEEEEGESIVDRLMPNGFDLRQAVVLNAILERPYK